MLAMKKRTVYFGMVNQIPNSHNIAIQTRERGSLKYSIVAWSLRRLCFKNSQFFYPSVWNDNEDFGNSFRTTNNIYLAKVFQLRKTMWKVPPPSPFSPHPLSERTTSIEYKRVVSLYSLKCYITP